MLSMLYNFTININIPIDKYRTVIHSIFLYFFIFIVIYSVVLIVSLYFIFKKENIKPFYALIPFFNIYTYFKITKTPFWTIFLPMLNLIVLFCVTYRLAKQYECPKWIVNLSIPLSIIVMPYIAFSRRVNKNLKNKISPLKSIIEIDNIDSRYMQEEIENVLFDEYYEPNDKNSDVFNSVLNDKIQNIESTEQDNLFLEEIIETSFTDSMDSSLDNDVNMTNIVNVDDDILEIFDEIPESITAAEIRDIEEKLESKNITIVDNAEYKELEGLGLSSEAIAFGGKQQNETVPKAKKERFKCPRCGSNLVGSSTSCPGCGMNLKNT